MAHNRHTSFAVNFFYLSDNIRRNLGKSKVFGDFDASSKQANNASSYVGDSLTTL